VNVLLLSECDTWHVASAMWHMEDLTTVQFDMCLRRSSTIYNKRETYKNALVVNTGQHEAGAVACCTVTAHGGTTVDPPVVWKHLGISSASAKDSKDINIPSTPNMVKAYVYLEFVHVLELHSDYLTRVKPQCFCKPGVDPDAWWASCPPQLHAWRPQAGCFADVAYS
jgi:hypothetical protein